ncbi:hypothetical protein [Jeotgalibacillus campisalis]|uniref:Uncharacterized protein n=1 Tax=Jeotgalibacillus campisalis TaxID=220754 RepID=A0A0C2SAB5_9BACL|nr:hypothetical protein [Jeotgalibacillus campisalis]KIL50904.1 hypothetical protein KR50_07850 [Jeotgalibacillus campisalis]
MRKFIVSFVLVVIIALITFNINNNKIRHQPISLEKVEEIVVFQEFYKVNNGGGGVTIEHLDSNIDTMEAKQLVQWFNSVSNENIISENELPQALAGVSFEMKNNKRVVVHYHEGIFYVSNKDNTYSFVNHDMKSYFEKILKQNEANPT